MTSFSEIVRKMRLLIDEFRKENVDCSSMTGERKLRIYFPNRTLTEETLARVCVAASIPRDSVELEDAAPGYVLHWRG